MSDPKQRHIPWFGIAGVMAAVGGVVVLVTLFSATSVPYNAEGPSTQGPLALEDVRLPTLTGHEKAPEPPVLDAEAGLPAAPVLTRDGESARVSERYQGRVVLLNLWADWCPPCLAEMPSLDRLEATLGSDAFSVVPVSLSTSLEDGVAYYDKAELAHLPFYHDETFASVARELKASNAMPISVLFNAQGREVGRVIGDAAWDSPEAVAWIRSVIGRSASEPDLAAGG